MLNSPPLKTPAMACEGFPSCLLVLLMIANCHLNCVSLHTRLRSQKRQACIGTTDSGQQSPQYGNCTPVLVVSRSQCVMFVGHHRTGIPALINCQVLSLHMHTCLRLCVSRQRCPSNATGPLSAWPRPGPRPRSKVAFSSNRRFVGC